MHFVFAENQEHPRSTQDARAAQQVPGLSRIVYDDPRGLRSHAAGPDQRAGADAPGPGAREGASPVLRRGGGRGPPGRCVGDPLHLGHDGPAQGRVPDTPQLHRLGRGRVSSPMGSTAATTCCPTCRRPGWVTTCSRSRSGWWPVSPSTARRSSETVHIDMREIGPTYYFAPPRVVRHADLGVDPHGRRCPVQRWLPPGHGRASACRSLRHPGRQTGRRSDRA